MTFANPLALVGLLALPALIAIYVFTGRAKPLVVSSLFLYQQQKQIKTGGPKFQRLQTPLILLLEALIIILTVLAIAGPVVSRDEVTQPLVLILDDSFSMRAGDPDCPRNKALVAIADLLEKGNYAPVRLLYAGKSPRLDPSRLAENPELLESSWKCLQSDFQLETAMVEAAGLHGANTRILVITDHEPPVSWRAENTAWWAFGRPMVNTGIITAARGDGGRCVVEILNAGDESQDVSLTLSGALRSSLELQMEAGEKRQLVFTVQDDAIPLSLSLQDDNLNEDNHAWLAPPRQPRIVVKVELPGGDLRSATLRALATLPQVTIADEDYDLLITSQSFSRSERPKTAEWSLHLPVQNQGAGFLGPFVTNADHPLLDGVDLSGVIWYSSGNLEMTGQPLITLGEKTLLAEEIIFAPGGIESRHFMLDYLVAGGTLHQTPNWPILFWNIVRMRGQMAEGPERTNIDLGEAIQIRVSPEADSFTVINQAETIDIPAPSGVGLWQPSQSGIYQLGTASSAAHTVAVNALSAEESDLRAASSGKTGTLTVEKASMQTTGVASMVLLILALLFFIAHGWLTRGITA